MDKITSKDIDKIREYRDKLEALERERPQYILTPEEWEEAMQGIHKTGNIPEKYEGRIVRNEEVVYDDIVDGEHKTFPEGVTKVFYYDVAEAEYDKQYNNLAKEYRDSILKAIQTYFDLREQKTEGEEESISVRITDIIAELLEDPIIRRELEKEAAAAQMDALAPLGSVPNGEILHFLSRVKNKNLKGRAVEASKGNRHEEVTVTQRKNTLTFTRKTGKETFIVEIENEKTSKAFPKLMKFSLEKMTAQNFPLEVGFNLQELVDLGIYSDISNARRAFKNFFADQKKTSLKGSIRKGKKTIHEEGGVLFYHYTIDNNFVKLFVNENFNMEFIASYFTIFPRFAYALGSNAFSLVDYIFFLARQHADSIKNKGTFTISLDAVRENLGLPSVDEVKNRKYKEKIIDPIEAAIEEVEKALQNLPEAKDEGFTITPYGTDTSNINEWLNGYLQIGLSGKFAEPFTQLATKTEKDREQWNKLKQKELARIAAKNEAKAAKEGTAE